MAHQQLGYIMPLTSVYTGKYGTEDKSKIQTLQKLQQLTPMPLTISKNT